MNVDTLAIAKRLAKGGFTAEQAETSAQIIGELVDSELATKRDLKELELMISQVESSLKRDMKELELKIGQVEANLKRDLKELEVTLRRDIKESELKLEKSLADMHRQMWQVSVGTALMVITVLGFLFRFTAR
jgi:predicted phage-related endonuclease